MQAKTFWTLLATLAAGCVTAPQPVSEPIPAAWMSVPATPRIGSIALANDGTVTPSSIRIPTKLADGPIRFEDGKLKNGENVLAGDLEIDSLDLSEVRQEVAFSAKHDASYDIALIATEGGKIHWMPNDPADEVAVQWAPRGHKISYILKAAGGDLVRTLHIPTAYQFAIPFPGATIHALAWDPQAERYAVAYSTADSSDRVEVLKYDGDERRTAIAPERTLDVMTEPFAPGAIVLHPRDIRYDEKLPLVIWPAEDFGWSDARAALLTNARVAVVVVKGEVSADVWRIAEQTPWIDIDRAYTVGIESERGISIVADPTLTDRYQRRGNLVAVPPAVVQSFAAGFLAAQLERTPPKNGSSR